jgi:hypothetical protein
MKGRRWWSRLGWQVLHTDQPLKNLTGRIHGGLQLLTQLLEDWLVVLKKHEALQIVLDATTEKRNQWRNTDGGLGSAY